MRRAAPPIFLLAALSAFGPITTDAYLPALPQMQDDLGASAAAAQVTLTACILGLAVGQLIVGPWSDAAGRRRPLLVGMLAFTAASAGCAIAPSVAVLDVARLVQGLAGSAGIVIARAMVRDAHPDSEATRVYATLGAVVGIAPIVAPISGGLLLKVTDWRGIFWALAAFGVLLLLACLRFAPETLPLEARAQGHLGEAARSYRALLADGGFRAAAVTGCLAFGALFTYISSSSLVLQESLGLGPQAYAVSFAVNALCLTTAAIVNRRVVETYGPRRMLSLGLVQLFAGSLVLLALGAVEAGRAAVLVMLAVTVSSYGLIAANTVAIGMARAGSRAGSAAALLGIVVFVVGALAAPVTGLLDPTVATMGSVMAAFGLLALRARPRHGP